MPPRLDTNSKVYQDSKDPFSSAQLALDCIGNDKTVPRVDIVKGTLGINYFKEKWALKGIDLDKIARETRGKEEIKNRFAEGKENGIGSQLAEMLPLFANTKGRLGDYREAKVIKAHKYDDQGNSRVDIILVLTNNWVKESGNKEVSPKMSFLIDVTSGDEEKKQDNLINFYLAPAEKASVKCYEDQFGSLGLIKPKLIMGKTRDYLVGVGAKLGEHIRRNASDSFTINNPERFDAEYREYFNEFIDGCIQNAIKNADYLRRFHFESKKHITLAEEYERMASFLDFYKKTPIKKSRSYDITQSGV